MIRFNVPHQDALAIDAIVDRARRTNTIPTTALTLHMDLTAVHANGTPLDLPKLLAADEFNFAHDINGITRHLDRNTGKLLHFFLPRCAKPEA